MLIVQDVDDAVDDVVLQRLVQESDVDDSRRLHSQPLISHIVHSPVLLLLFF